MESPRRYAFHVSNVTNALGFINFQFPTIRTHFPIIGAELRTTYKYPKFPTVAAYSASSTSLEH